MKKIFEHFLIGSWLLIPLLLLDFELVPIITFLTLTMAIGFFNCLSKPINTLLMMLQSAQMLNVLTTQNLIYIAQLKSIIIDTSTAVEMTVDLISTTNVLISLTYLGLGLYLIRKSSTIKISFNNVFLLIICIITPYITLISAKILVSYHPVQYLQKYLTNSDFRYQIKEPPRTPVTINGVDSAKRIILVIGESQGSLSEEQIREVMPNLHREIESGHAVAFQNAHQVGSYTAISVDQIVESTTIDRLHLPHTSFLQIAERLNKNSSYISSRHLSWSGLEDRIENYWDNVLDCRIINRACRLLDGIDDLEMLEKVVMPEINSEPFNIVWHINGSHTPLHDKFTHDKAISSTDDYLNSINYTDQVIGKLIGHMPEDTLLIFMSDHSHDRTGNESKILSFVYSKTKDLSTAKLNKFKPINQLDLIKTIFESQGAFYSEANTFNPLSEVIPKRRDLYYFNSFNPENKIFIR